MDEVEQIKRRIDIVDLISGYLTLKKAGINYKALCPFHQEKTPSFMVSPEKQIWHCFGGCSEGGDIFTFVMKMENLEFREALEMLAQKAGVKLERRKSSFAQASEDRPDRKSRLFQINSLAAQVFHKILLEHPSGKPALEYLKKRKLTIETIKDFMLGYTPSSKAMLAYFKKRGFSDSELQAAGNPDRFFQRIIFPIKDVLGNTIAFTGRVLDPKQEPKYLNTPETVIFRKSRVLYNLEKARGEIRISKSVVVVEGQMDVIASFQAGVKNVVATSGTSLTDEHLKILSRYTPNIIFAFDSDTAGLSSAKKAYEMAIVAGFNVKMVHLGEFKDPGEMIAQSPERWGEAVKKATSVIDWYFSLAFGKRQTANGEEMTSQQKKEIAREILPIIKKMPDMIEQAHYVGLLAKRLAVPERAIYDALARVSEQRKKGEKDYKARRTGGISMLELLLGLVLRNPQNLAEVQNKIQPTDFSEKSLGEIYKALLKLYNESKKSNKDTEKKNLVRKLKKSLEPALQNKVDEIMLISEASEENLAMDLPAILQKISQNRREALKSYYAEAIKKAELEHNHRKLKKLIEEFQNEISK